MPTIRYRGAVQKTVNVLHLETDGGREAVEISQAQYDNIRASYAEVSSTIAELVNAGAVRGANPRPPTTGLLMEGGAWTFSDGTRDVLEFDVLIDSGKLVIALNNGWIEKVVSELSISFDGRGAVTVRRSADNAPLPEFSLEKNEFVDLR